MTSPAPALSPVAERMNGGYEVPILTEPVGGPVPVEDDPDSSEWGDTEARSHAAARHNPHHGPDGKLASSGGAGSQTATPSSPNTPSTPEPTVQ